MNQSCVPLQSSSGSYNCGSGGQQVRKLGNSQLCHVSLGREQGLHDGNWGTAKVREAGCWPGVYYSAVVRQRICETIKGLQCLTKHHWDSFNHALRHWNLSLLPTDNNTFFVSALSRTFTTFHLNMRSVFFPPPQQIHQIHYKKSIHTFFPLSKISLKVQEINPDIHLSTVVVRLHFQWIERRLQARRDV